VFFATNGNSLYFTGAPKAPPEELQPDIILNETEKVGDDVHQNDPARRRRSIGSSREHGGVFIHFSSRTTERRRTRSSSPVQGRETGISSNGTRGTARRRRFPTMSSVTDAPTCWRPGQGARASLANRQTLENKGKEKTIKMKATSTIDKKFRDAFEITINLIPVP
jgi:hypothetical protein